jgi:ABC-type long-subunit fatty acid transport system fused permease/ATPase subunit
MIKEMFTKTVYMIVSFVKTSAIKAILYLQAYMMFYVYFLHSLNDFGKIWCKISAHNVAEPCEF